MSAPAFKVGDHVWFWRGMHGWVPGRVVCSRYGLAVVEHDCSLYDLHGHLLPSDSTVQLNALLTDTSMARHNLTA